MAWMTLWNLTLTGSVNKFPNVGEIGLCWTLFNAVFLNISPGFVPGPIAFGAIVDSSCLLWRSSCGADGSCQLYDNASFRYRLHATTAMLIAASDVLCAVVTTLLWRRHWKEVKDVKKPSGGGDIVLNIGASPPQEKPPILSSCWWTVAFSKLQKSANWCGLNIKSFYLIDFLLCGLDAPCFLGCWYCRVTDFENEMLLLIYLTCWKTITCR